MLLKDVINLGAPPRDLEANDLAMRGRSERYSVKVCQKHVHKTEDQNRFLKWMTVRENAEGETIYSAEVRFIRDHPYFFEHDHHPYFFEHDRQHLPGLYIIEAGRQLGLAVPHLFLDVGYDYHSVLDGCDMSFSGFATLTDPLFIDPFFEKGRYNPYLLTEHLFKKKSLLYAIRVMCVLFMNAS